MFLFCVLHFPVFIFCVLCFPVFEGDDKVQRLAAKSERDRDSWIENLHIASYECMKMQLESLRDQIRSRTGRDPIDNPEPSELPDVIPGKIWVRSRPH